MPVLRKLATKLLVPVGGQVIADGLARTIRLAQIRAAAEREGYLAGYSDAKAGKSPKHK